MLTILSKDKETIKMIDYCFDNIKQEEVTEIAYNWKYKGKYSFYNIGQAQADLESFLNPESWHKIFAAKHLVKDKIELIGFATYNFENDIMWIGFGMKPSYTGKGLGKSFVKAAVKFGIKHYSYREPKILLSVAQFNKRAIKVYTRVGFKPIEQKENIVNGKNYSFITMGLSI